MFCDINDEAESGCYDIFFILCVFLPISIVICTRHFGYFDITLSFVALDMFQGCDASGSCLLQKQHYSRQR